MRSQGFIKRHVVLAVTVAGIVVVALTSCMTTGSGSSGVAETGGQSNVAMTASNGAEVWAQNCRRCHNLRPPDEFSYAQWDVIVHHMRVRANLTADETRAILAFLKAAASADSAPGDAGAAN